MDWQTFLSIVVQAMSAFAGAAWATRRLEGRVAKVEARIDEHEKKDFQFHAKVEAVLWPAQR